MRQTAKLFKNGRSQAVRLPAEFRFEGDEVYIRRDEETGEVIISAKAGHWDDFFALADKAGVPDEFMVERDNDIEQPRELF